MVIAAAAAAAIAVTGPAVDDAQAARSTPWMQCAWPPGDRPTGWPNVGEPRVRIRDGEARRTKDCRLARRVTRKLARQARRRASQGQAGPEILPARVFAGGLFNCRRREVMSRGAYGIIVTCRRENGRRPVVRAGFGS